MSYVSGDFGDPETYQRVARAIGEARCPVFYLEIPPFLFGRVIKGLTRRGADQDRAGGGREAVRPRPRVGAGAGGGDPPVHRRVPAVPDRSLPGEDGHRRDHLPAVRERDVRADLEPQLRLERPDHDGRELRGRGPRALLRPRRRAARRRRQPHDAGGGGAAMEVPSSGEADVLKDALVSVYRAMPAADPGALRARAVRGLPRRSTASPPTRRPRRTPRCGWRSTTGGGRACRSSCVPESACRSRRPSCASCSDVRRGWGSRLVAHARAEPARRQAGSVDRHPAAGRRPAPRDGRARADQPRHGVRRRRAARARLPTRCSCTPR